MLGAAASVAAPAAASASAIFKPPRPTKTTVKLTQIGKDVFTGSAAGTRGQGVTTDGTHWYFSSTNSLEITDLQFNSLLVVSPAIPPELANPGPLARKGLNHIGDMDYSDGLLYIALDSSAVDPNTGPGIDSINEYNTPVFCTYNAADLTFTGHAVALNPPHGVNDIASWQAIDPRRRLAYGMGYIFGEELGVFNLPDWTFKEYVEASRQVNEPQGGKVHDGWIYFSQDNATHDISRMNLETGEVQLLTQLTTPFPQEVEGLSFLETPHGLTLNILNREQPDPTQPGDIAFYHFLVEDFPRRAQRP
jgi:hypothetical protein